MEKHEALRSIKTIFEPGSVDFREIAKALQLVMTTREDREKILKAGMKKIKAAIQKGEFAQLAGVNEFISALTLKIDVGEDIAETVAGLLTTVLPTIRLGVLENISAIPPNADDMKRTVRDYLVSSGMTTDTVSEKLLNQMIEYRFVNATLKEKEIERVDSFADLIDALTLEKRIYQLKKADILDLVPGSVLDSEIKDSIEQLLTQAVHHHPEKLTTEEKEDLTYLISFLQKRQVNYTTYPGETSVSLVLTPRDETTNEEIVWSREDLLRIKSTAALLGTKAVRYVRERSQFEEINPE